MNSPTNLRRAIGIVADDLTSAADGAAPFLRGSGPVRVHRGLPDDLAHAVLSVDTGSRARTEAQAGRVAAQATRALAARGILYKTMDSTLRGHVRTELAAAMRASGRLLLVVAPAFADAGRVTREGIQYVHGVPVDASPYGADPVHPARSARLLDLIDPDIGPACVIPEDASAMQLRAAIAAARVLVLDAGSQRALDARVAQLWQQGSACLWAGSPGLARALAAQCVDAGAAQRACAVTRRAARVLVVAGSANPASQAQCEALRAAGARLATRADEIAGEDTLACLRAQRSPQAEPAAVLAALVAQARRAMARHRFDGLVATGGDTLAALLDALAIDTFTLTCELAPGFPAGTAVCAGRPLSIAMKAGGFGGPGALRDAAWRLLCR
ncbi:four-carbon acid sugar kinase family protein [Achromobacter pulmonis]|uniref:four-carbon acid sugar kinase family protein n=1 Tax=Achromobacter pulmonis TaxID=1389932 RepID=UPI001F44A889|nr:four-carbon acid sugar kinase family protein [Achromobacter pulmonis]MCF7770734.1 hypothetical protein [Achromobacter pulmonis]